MLRIQRQDSNVADFNSAIKAHDLDTRVSAIGIISSYNPTNSTAEIQLVSKEGVRDMDGTVESKELPLLLDVPICFPHSKEHAITFPIKEGDECIVVFSDRAIDNWWQNGGVQEQNIDRMHDLSDAIAFVAPYSQKTKLGTNGSEEPNSDNLQIRSFSGKTYIEIESEDNKHTINILNNESGNMTIKIMNGTLDIYAKGNTTFHTDGTMDIYSKGAMTIRSDTDIALSAPHVGLND